MGRKSEGQPAGAAAAAAAAGGGGGGAAGGGLLKSKLKSKLQAKGGARVLLAAAGLSTAPAAKVAPRSLPLSDLSLARISLTDLGPRRKFGAL